MRRWRVIKDGVAKSWDDSEDSFEICIGHVFYGNPSRRTQGCHLSFLKYPGDRNEHYAPFDNFEELQTKGTQ